MGHCLFSRVTAALASSARCRWTRFLPKLGLQRLPPHSTEWKVVRQGPPQRQRYIQYDTCCAPGLAEGFQRPGVDLLHRRGEVDHKKVFPTPAAHHLHKLTGNDATDTNDMWWWYSAAFAPSTGSSGGRALAQSKSIAWACQAHMFLGQELSAPLPLACGTKAIFSSMCGGMYEWMNEWTNECLNVCMYEWMNEWVYEWMYVWMNERMSVWMNVCTYVWMNERMSVWMYVCMYVWMNEWMSVCMYEWMNEWMSEWMKEWKNERVKERKNEWMNEWMNKWMNECMNVCMNEWMTDWLNEWMNEYV